MLTERKYYNTKISRLTFAIGMEPEDYISDKLRHKWSMIRIYIDLRRISNKYNLDMISERSLRLWIKKVINKKKQENQITM